MLTKKAIKSIYKYEFYGIEFKKPLFYFTVESSNKIIVLRESWSYEFYPGFKFI